MGDSRDTLLYGSISVGMFLFLLFFQPFPNRFTDLNSVLIFHAGFGAILFVLLYIIHMLSRLFKNYDKDVGSYLHGIVLFLLSSVAFTFYLRYVGQANITFYLVVKTALICLVSPVILRIYRYSMELKQENEFLQDENLALQRHLQQQASNKEPELIELYSAETTPEMLKVSVKDLAMIRSADNYVELYCIEHDHPRKKLIRNTLRNIEQLLLPSSRFIRCHRTCIVNIGFVEKSFFTSASNTLLIKGFNEHIPVSRQYILKLKEALDKHQG